MYGKLFAQMYDGTLASKGPWQALVTFQQLIILADQDGNIDMTPEAIARRTTVPLEIIQEGLQRLQEPDPESRTPDESGRRITLLSESRGWGWHIVNYEHYRKLRNSDERRAYQKQYYRTVTKPKHDSTASTISFSSTDSTEAVSNKQKHIYTGAKTSRALSIPDDLVISDQVRDWAETTGVANLDAHFNNFVSVCKAKGYKYADWDEALIRAIRDDWAKLSAVQKRTDGLAL